MAPRGFGFGFDDIYICVVERNQPVVVVPLVAGGFSLKG